MLVPGYGFFVSGFFCSTGGTNGLGCPGLTAVLSPEEFSGLLFGYGFEGNILSVAGAEGNEGEEEEDPLSKDGVRPPTTLPTVLLALPTTPLLVFLVLLFGIAVMARRGTPPTTLFAVLVAPPIVFVAPPTAPPSVFFAGPVTALTWFLPGYLFAPSGVPPTGFDPNFEEAGKELDLLTAGLRAVDGRALADG